MDYDDYESEPEQKEMYDPLLIPQNREGSESVHKPSKATARSPNDILHTILVKVNQTNEAMSALKADNIKLREQLRMMAFENKKSQTRLLNEINTLKHQLNDSRAEVTAGRRVGPRTPCTCIQEFEAFDEQIRESTQKSDDLEEEFFLLSETDVGKFVRTMWKSLMTDEVATNYSWRGTATKGAVKALAVTIPLHSAFQRRFPTNEKDFERATCKWFQTANDRIKHGLKSLRGNISM